MNMVCCCQVCDEPHPLLIKDMLQHCVNGNVDEAYKIMAHLWRLGYSAEDIIGIIFRVCKTHDMPEYLKLEFIKVRRISYVCQSLLLKHLNNSVDVLNLIFMWCFLSLSISFSLKLVFIKVRHTSVSGRRRPCCKSFLHHTCIYVIIMLRLGITWFHWLHWMCLLETECKICFPINS